MTEVKWLTAHDPDRMLSFLERASRRKLRLFACACCRRVWDHPWTAASQEAVEVAERFADGWADVSQLTAARAAVEALLELYPQEPMYDPAHLACAEQIEVGALRAATYAANIPRLVLERTLNLDDAQAEAHIARERAAQCDLVRDIFGNPIRPVAFDPAWLTESVVALARGIYDDRAFDRLPILADALVDAGCADFDMLTHCREPGPHARGCWVIDRLTGRE